ncbi:MAG: hypothetical protein WC314_21955 [Vulcanimicrobiota bacterium]
MTIDEGKLRILAAFCELAWADGRVTQAQADFIADLAAEMDMQLGSWLPCLVTGLSRPPRSRIENLAEIPIDEVERFQVVERFVAMCLLGDGLSSEQAGVLARLSLQLGIKAKELEEMRRRLC